MLLAYDLGHLAQSLGSTSLELGGGVGVGVLEGWKHKVADFLSGQVFEALTDV